MGTRSQNQSKSSPEAAVTPPQNILQPRPFAQPAQAEAASTLEDPQNQVEHTRQLGHHVANFAASQPDPPPPTVQPKLTIGAPGDKYEQEADRVAQQVVQRIHNPKPAVHSLDHPQPASAVQREPNPLQHVLQLQPLVQQKEMSEEDELQPQPILQRKTEAGPTDASTDLERAIQQSRGSGQPIANSIRQPLEHAFGNVDFSGVKVHTDTQSDQLSRSIQAKAFTTGQDVFFQQGAYNPSSREGQELIAHELTHVIQQNGSRVHRKVDSAVTQPISIAPVVSIQTDKDGDELEPPNDQLAPPPLLSEAFPPLESASDEEDFDLKSGPSPELLVDNQSSENEVANGNSHEDNAAHQNELSKQEKLRLLRVQNRIKGAKPIDKIDNIKKIARLFAQKRLKNEVTKIAGQTGGRASEPPASKSIGRMLEKIGGSVYMYMNEQSYELIKDQESSLVNKVETELDKVPESLADVARMTIYYQNFVTMKNGIETLRGNDKIPLVDERNTYATKEAKTKESGYRDVNIKVLIPIYKTDTQDGEDMSSLIEAASRHLGTAHMFVGEIQLKLESFDAIEHDSHKDYEEQRTLKGDIQKLQDKKKLTEKDKKNLEKYTEELKKVEGRLKDYSSDYNKAYTAALSDEKWEAEKDKENGGWGEGWEASMEKKYGKNWMDELLKIKGIDKVKGLNFYKEFYGDEEKKQK